MKINQLKTGVMMSYATMFLSNLIAIVYTPIMLRLLGQSEYGIYNLVNSVVGYLGLLSFGFDNTYVRYYSRYKVKNDEAAIARLNGMFIVVFSAIGIVSLIAGGVLVFNTENMFGAKLTSQELYRAKILMIILVFNISLSFPFTVFKSNVTANEKYLFQKTLNLMKTVVSPLITLPLLFMGFRSVGMVISTTVICVIIEVSNAVFCFRRLKIKFDFKGFDKLLLKEIAVFSSYIFINIIVDQINWSVDKFLLGIYQGAVAIAIYGLAAQLNTYYMSFSTSISSVLVPRVNRMAAIDGNHKALTELFAKVGRLQFIVLSLILSGMIFFGRPFISMWAGADYAESYKIMLILVIPVTIPLVQTLGMEIQRAMNLHKFRAYLYLGIAVLNTIISISLCKRYSGVGCAIGTAFALLLGNGVVMNIFYHKKMKLNIIYFWGQIIRLFPSVVLSSVVGVIILKTQDLYDIRRFIVSVIVFIICFCTSMYFLGMNEYEKNLIIKPLRKIIGKKDGSDK